MDNSGWYNRFNQLPYSSHFSHASIHTITTVLSDYSAAFFPDLDLMKYNTCGMDSV